jgi:hypothetical protein
LTNHRLLHGSPGKLHDTRANSEKRLRLTPDLSINATGIPQYGREWMAREDHV